jgi:cell division inhibitor SulA
MRLYAPLYESDTLLRPDAAFGEPAVTVFKTPAPAASFVRSNIQAEAANEPVLDLRAIEQTAHALRGATVAHLLKAAYTAVVDWLERIDTQERDNFFAAAENLADLESRQRHYERSGCAHY